MSDTLGSLDTATEILGDKWTPRLLRYFFEHRCLRFCQLQDLAEEINPRTLSARLVKLEEAGIIKKKPTSVSRCEYLLTQKGEDLYPVIKSMADWSQQY